MAKPRKQAYCLVIGNEILTGKVKDINSVFFAHELTALGTEVRGIFIIPDEMEVIGDHVAKLSQACDFLLTSGGVGPTHDDITMAGIAAGLGLPIEENQEIISLLSHHFNGEIPHALKKMARVPKGVKLIPGKDLWYPLVTLQNIYIFPGDPTLLKKKFESVKELFRGEPRVLKKIYLAKHEHAFAEQLAQVQTQCPQVAIGSYPRYPEDRFSAMVTFEADSSQEVEESVAAFLEMIPSDWVVPADAKE